MSENHDEQQVKQGPGAAEDGDQGPDSSQPVELLDPSLNSNAAPIAEDNHVIQLPDDVDGSIDSELNKESVSPQIGHDNGVSGGVKDSVQDEPDTGIVAEEAGREDMFVDCPDELVVNVDSRETVVASEKEENLGEEKLNNLQQIDFKEMDHMAEYGFVMNEVEHLKDMLEKVVSEKESISCELKEEREAFARELARLHHQLMTLTNQPSNGNQLIESLHNPETGLTAQALVTDNMKDLVDECTQFLKKASDDRLQTEATIRELHAILMMKDHEIEDLNSKVVEISVSNDAVGSYVTTMQNSLELSAERDKHVELVMDRMLASLSPILNKEEQSDDSVFAKVIHVERGTSLLIEHYNQVLSGIYQLRQCFSGDETLGLQDFGSILSAARAEFLELKGKQADSVEKLRHFEEENSNLNEQLDNHRMAVEKVNIELDKTKLELEHERIKFANTKEKLSMAVTKGKALVQQRDALKQSLADKSNELERCTTELQEKSTQLEAAELSKSELFKSENLVASLQETVLQKNQVLEKIDEILSEVNIPEGTHSNDIIERFRWLVDENKILNSVSLEFHKLKDVFFPVDIPEIVSSSDLESRLYWLRDSFFQAKDEIIRLQEELSGTREAAEKEIGLLSASLSIELQEKDYLQGEVDDLKCKYKEISEKERLVSLEKDQIVKMLLEHSGVVIEGEGVDQDISLLVDKCFQKIKKQSGVPIISPVEMESFERIQSLLYIRNQDLILVEKILEEELSELDNLSNGLRAVSQELLVVKEEKGVLQKDLERSEEKLSLLREKLSMAVKKGKGLVQDRENMKRHMDEKNSEIEKLRLELQSQESIVADCRTQIISLSTEAELIPKLESDLYSMEEEKNKLEQFLLESNNILQRVIESIDCIVLPVNTAFKEPVEKVKWLAGYINECHHAKIHTEQELGKMNEEVSTLASKLADASSTVKSLEDALSAADGNISRFAEEKREVEAGKAAIEKKLQKAIDEAHSQSIMFAEALSARNILEEALSQAENKLTLYMNEKEEAQVSMLTTQTDLAKAKEEMTTQTSELAEAHKTIKSLEDALSQVHTNIALLTEQNNDAQSCKTILENELKKLKEEVGTQAGKLADAFATIKVLEDALLKAEGNISALEDSRKTDQEEILTLNSKLNACMEELAGTSGSLESRSIEFIGTLSDLQKLTIDETMLSTITRCFEKKFSSLKDMELILRNIRDCIASSCLEELQNHQAMEEFPMRQPSIDGNVNFVDIEGDNDKVITADSGDDISLSFRKALEGLWLRNKILTDKFEEFSSVMDDLVAVILSKLHATRDEVTFMFEHMESWKQKAKDLEFSLQEQENTKTMLENGVDTLLSACIDATRELQFEVTNSILDLGAVPELENVKGNLFLEIDGDTAVDQQSRFAGSKYGKTVEQLLLATRKAQALSKQFESTSNVAAATIRDMQNKLEVTRVASETAIEERDFNQDTISKLKTDVETLNSSCNELRLQLADYQAIEERLKEKEAEVSALYDTLLIKEKEAEDSLLSASQIKALFDMIEGIEIPMPEKELQDLGGSTDLKKLFYIINSITELQKQIELLSHNKEMLQSTLSTKDLEIENLKQEIGKESRDKLDSELIKKDLTDITFGLNKIVNLLGGGHYIGDPSSDGLRRLALVLEKQVMAILLECESSKSKVEELDTKLLGSQKLVNELSTKVKLLEDSLQGRTSQPEIVQERSIFEAPMFPTGSEISEIEDGGAVGKNGISSAPSAHVRTTRKGSTDHLTIHIDSESDRLIKDNLKNDEDKGRVFKSLNTTGFIPKQGKLIADRIDGIWVSGGRVLMSRPGARLGLIAYWLVMHIWLLGTIL